MNTVNHKYATTLTERRIKSSKGLNLCCSFVALLSDIVVLFVLLTNVTAFKFWICPLIIMMLDAIFFLSVIFSNYRFSYAFNGVIIHIVLLISVCTFAWIATYYLNDGIVFENIALYAMPVVHLVQCFAVFFTALYASKKGKAARRVLASLLTFSFSLIVVVYGNFLLTNGFFGQGFSEENRTVVYYLDEEKNQYIAKDILDGRGGSVLIPAEFNGLPVGGVDCELFFNSDIHTVRLECNTDVKFENAEAISDEREDLTILSSKDSMDAFRQAFYKLSIENSEAICLANSIYPSDLEDDEVYVTVRYSIDALQIADGEIIPTWFSTKGTVFDAQKHIENVSYVEHSDVTDNADLYYCYTQQEGKIFRMLADTTGSNINGCAISKSVEATLEFDKIYRLSISEDNDEKHVIDDKYRFLQTENGTFSYKLATSENIINVMNALPQRGGFTLEWYVGSDKHALESLNGELSKIDRKNEDCLELHPVWQLNAPIITKLTADGVTSNHSALYGSDVELYSSAISPDPSISIRYEWNYKGIVSDDSTYILTNIHPDDAGEYTLTVTAYSDTATSLTSSVSEKISVGFQKREMNFYWQLPAETVYSSYEKPIYAIQDASDVINNDEITIQLSRDGVKNVGVYKIEIILTGDANKKYYVADSDRYSYVTITPYRLNVNWGDSVSFEYSGVPMAPTASAMGLGDDGLLDVFVTGEEQNVGSYTATAETTNMNYELAGNTLTYHITPRSITIASWSADSLIYNGIEQAVTVASVSNAVKGEENKVIAEMLYFGKGVNVGEYVSVASLPTGSNYTLVGDVSKSFQITPKALNVTILDQNMTYSGSVFTEFRFTANGLAEKDKIEEVLSLSYKGEAVNAINASTKNYLIDADIIGNEKYNNYTVTLNTGTLRIEKKHLDIYLTDASKIYDGKIYPYEDFGFTHEGLVSSDSMEEICKVTFSGEAVSAVRASTNAYTLNATTSAQGKYDNYSITVHPATLVIKKAPLTITAVGGSKIYDGVNGSGFSFIVEGLVEGETDTILGAPIYGGVAANNPNVGNHVLTVSFAENTATRNYDITYENGLYVITKRDLTVTAIGGSKIYNGISGGNFDFEVKGLAATDSKANLGTPVYTGTAITGKDVNSYDLTVRLTENPVTNNYNIIYIDGAFVITPKSITVSAISSDKVYDGMVGGNFDFTVNGLVGGDTKDVLGTPIYSGTATSALNVGSYTISVVLPGNANYKIDLYTDALFQIKKKTVMILPYAEARVYDGTVGGTFDFNVSGLIENDSKVIFGSPVYSGTALTAKNAGNYTLSVTLPYDVEFKNYDLAYTTGSFEIQKKALTVTVLGDSKVYDGKACSDFGFEVSGLVGGDTKDMLGTPSYGGDAVSNKNAGVHNITVKLPNNKTTSNYLITYVDSTCIISKKTAVVTAVAADRVYDGTIGGEFDFSVSGLIGGETKAVLGTPTYAGTAPTAKNAGVYTLSVELSYDSIIQNYELTYINTYFEIQKKDLTVIAIGGSKVYDGKLSSEFDFKVNGLAAGDTKDMLGTPSYGGDAITNANAGVYTLTVELPVNTVTLNYNIEYVDSTYTISKKSLLIIAKATDRVYDGTKGGSFAFEINGLVESDSIDDFGTPIYGGTAIDAVQPGTYTLTVQFSDSQISSNYEITYVYDDNFVISEN